MGALMINYAIRYRYTAAHRYDSDLDDRAGEALRGMLKPGQMGGSGGGCWAADAGGSDLAADNEFYLENVTAEEAERARAAVDAVLKGYDGRYEATLVAWGDGEDGEDDEDRIDPRCDGQGFPIVDTDGFLLVDGYGLPIPRDGE